MGKKEGIPDILESAETWRADSQHDDRKLAERKQQEYNDIDWEDLYHRNQLSSLRVGELELDINHYNIAFKEKKDENVRVVKAHFGSKILSSIVKESQNNIQPASDSNSASNSDSDRVERIVGSSSNSSELNGSGDQAANSERSKKLKERYLRLVRLDTDGKGRESS